MSDTEPVRVKLELPTELLRANQADAVLVIRLGALACAVQSCVLHLLQKIGLPDTPGNERDRVVQFLASVGYLKEAIDHIQHRRERIQQLLNLLEEHGYDFELKWSDVSPLLTTGDGSIYRDLVKAVRHKLAFHLSEGQILDWLADEEADTVCLWDHATDGEGTWCPAFGPVVARRLAEGAGGTSEDAYNAVLGRVRDAQLTLIRLADATALGLVYAVGLTPEDCYKVERHQGKREHP